MNILALTTINNTLSLKEALDKIKKDYGEILRLKKVYLDDYEDPKIPLDEIKAWILESDIILVDIRGDLRLARELPGLIDGCEKTVVVLVWGGEDLLSILHMGNFHGENVIPLFKEKEMDFDKIVRSRNLEALYKAKEFLNNDVLEDIQNWIQTLDYYGQNDAENLKNMILFLIKKYSNELNNLSTKEIPLPQHQPKYGLYLPYQGIYEDLDEYKNAIGYSKEKPTIGILLYGGMHFDDTRPLAEGVYENLRNKANIITVFSNVENNIKAINRYMKDIDLFLNLQYFQINGGPLGGDPQETYKFFQKQNVPYLIGLRGYETDIEEWRNKKEGLNPLEIILGITLPELDGAIEPIFSAGLESMDDEDMGKIKLIKILPDRLEKLCHRMMKWIQLKRKDNSKKRIAIITYNYPPGEENLANAGYLDVFKSLKIFLSKLKESGYELELPEVNLKDLFLEQKVLNSPNYILKSGLKLHKEDYISYFNSLPLNIQESVKKHWGEAPGDVMVEGDYILIPGIDLGRVFLGLQPSRGVHEDVEHSYHDKELPPHHQYLAYYHFLEHYFKADAVLHFGTHGTLEFTYGKEVGLSSECFPDVLIGTMPNIYYYWVGNTSESTIAKRISYAICLSHASPNMKSSHLYQDYLILEDLLEQYQKTGHDKNRDLIMELASKLHLPQELDEISQELYRMKRRLIPDGLHVLDEIPENERLVDYLLGVLRIDRDYPSILKLIAEKEDKKWDKIKDSYQADKIEMEAKKIIEDIINGKNVDWLPEGYEEFVRNILTNVDKSAETEGLLRALNGEYIMPCRGGDPIRDPDVYPTGRSMNAFDPRQIPTVAADARGKLAAELLLESYLKKNGRYPEQVGVVLWGFETLKTGGDTISTILSLMGVRIKQQKGPWFKEIEVIPLEELKRPRIDVTITICGIFRDTLGTHIDLINRAVKKVAQLEEPEEMNLIRKHHLQDKKEIGESLPHRIFGPSPSEYATSMRTMVETSNWEDEEELVESYTESMSFAYGSGAAEKNLKSFNRAMERVDLVSQERDNIEYEVTDLDHYYEFLGGLSRTIESKKGEKAKILVVDTTEEELYVEDLDVTIERATRTRILNPSWIDGMLKHDFHGAKNIKDRMEHLLGFAATTGKVKNWVFDDVADKLVFDEEMRNRIQENNPYAAIKMGEVLLESESRGYWEVDDEKLRKLRNIVLDMESEVE
ncbi:MAG: cobaltochelatase subunit CobN [Methanobacteriaceae archaeon]|nr:cobaltochelatase subunit CobN [Methanobacteriaceae archaeon]